jgi:hypothetical protein
MNNNTWIRMTGVLILVLRGAIGAFAQQNQNSPVISAKQAAQITRDWASAINSGNLEQWMNLHAPNVEFANHSWFIGNTRAEMRTWGQAVIDAKGVYTITEQSIQNGRIIWMIDYKDRSFAIKEMGTVTVVNGQISRLILGKIP